MSFRTFVPLIVSALALAGCNDANQSNPMDETGRAINCSYPSDRKPTEPANPPDDEDVLNAGETKVTLHLTAGDVEITIGHSATPCTINSFMSPAQRGWFSRARYHRLTGYDIFMLQCEDPTGTGKGGSDYMIPDGLSPRIIGLEKKESAVTYPKGAVAMANADGPSTAGPQFLIVWEDSRLSLDYTAFGIVDESRLAVMQGVATQGVDETNRTSPIAEAIISLVTLS